MRPGVFVSLSMLAFIVVAPPSGEAAPEPLSPQYSSDIAPKSLPVDGREPLRWRRSTQTSTSAPDGAMPFERGTSRPSAASDSALSPDGVDPLGDLDPPPDAPVPSLGEPLGKPAPVPPKPPIDPKTVRLVRLDLLFGPMWRLQRVDTLIMTSAEFGRKHGFSAAFHTAVLVDTQRESVQAIDVPIGVGAIARGHLRKRPLSGSIGLSAGILVHRAKTERGVIRRVDPDFRLPIRFAWTIATIGLSLVIEQGYSVRHRNYERRGVEVWGRHAYRIGFALGLHSDILAGRPRRAGHRRGRRL